MSDFANGVTADNKAEQPPFFVVSSGKLAVVGFFTFGIYWLYCFYQNWKLHKARTGEEVSPFWRCFFAFLFIYPLLRRVNDCIRESGKASEWSILGLTLAQYALAVAGVAVNAMLEGRPAAVLLASFVCQAAWVMLFIAMQNGINLSAGDVSGQSNNRLTLANWLWMLPGIGLQLMMVFALVVIAMA
ncbi:hypothetical protein [Pseudomonas putida]|uniref:hypothetical protein n=1 Tax=Pseudomonas putida TaxID=303 RepID=UPI0005BBDA2C|nr:hypothetical protein [Pseudomonas putida]